MRVSVRAVIGALSAVLVTAVATVTLSLAVTSSLDALRAMGTRHAAALLDVADTAAVSLFAGTTDQVMSFVNFTAGDNWTFPSEVGGNRTLDAFMGATRTAASRGFPVITTLSVFFADNTWIIVDGTRAEWRPSGEAAVFVAEGAQPFSAGAASQTVYESAYLYSYRTLRTRPLPGWQVSQLTPLRNTSLWRTLDIGTSGSFAPAVYTPSAIPRAGPEQFMLFLPMGAPLYTMSATARGQQHVFGYVILTMELQDIGAFLARAKSTPNTVAFALDRSGYLLGTSESTPFATARPITGSVVPPGCTSTADARPTMTGHVLACRAHTSEYPNAALNALAAQRPELLRPADGAAVVERVGDVGGEPYYVDTKRVRIAFRGLEVYLLLLMPEADVIGDVITSRNVAIGVTCALVVLAAAVNVAVVWALLAPLGGIAERMVRAANLEDDGEDASVSAMAEVAELQEAYYAMNAELNRIRSYVPQNVLMACSLRDVSESAGDEFEDDPDMASISFIGGAGSLLYRRKASAFSLRSAGGFQGAEQSSSLVAFQRPAAIMRAERSVDGSDGSSSGSTPRSLRTVAKWNRSTSFRGMIASPRPQATSRNATVVVANVRGLHSLLVKGVAESPEGLTDVVAAAATLVERCVSQRKGAVTFHGDRFFATFNTARPCAGHAAKAAAAAVAIASASKRELCGLPITAGVATGPCLVGSVGSATMKTLSTVGPAVSNAALLEQLTREHDGVSVLATHRTCVDAATAVRVRYVDFVALKGAGPDPLRGGAAGSLVSLRKESPARGGGGGVTGNGGSGSPLRNTSSSCGAANAINAASISAANDEEWMYVLDGQENSDPHAAFNACFEALDRGDIAGCLRLYHDRRRVSSVAGSQDAPLPVEDIPSPPAAAANAAPPARLAAIVERLEAGACLADIARTQVWSK